MTQKNRPAVHIDITNKQTVDAANDAKITATNWKPGAGAEQARLRAEQMAREQHQREMDRYNQDPTVQRIINLEKQNQLMQQQIIELIKSVESLKLIGG